MDWNALTLTLRLENPPGGRDQEEEWGEKGLEVCTQSGNHRRKEECQWKKKAKKRGASVNKRFRTFHTPPLQRIAGGGFFLLRTTGLL